MDEDGLVKTPSKHEAKEFTYIDFLGSRRNKNRFLNSHRKEGEISMFQTMRYGGGKGLGLMIGKEDIRKGFYKSMDKGGKQSETPKIRRVETK